MKALIVFAASLIAGIQSVQVASGATEAGANDTEVIESTILWRAELDEATWAPIELEKVLSNTTRYSPSGNFFKVNETLYVFGHQAIYIGMLGVELVPGPNAVLRGEPSSVSNSIAEKYQIEFTKKGNDFVAEIDKYIKLIITPHPGISGATIIIGGYFGP